MHVSTCSIFFLKIPTTILLHNFLNVFMVESLNSCVRYKSTIHGVKIHFSEKRGLGLTKYYSQTLQNHISHICDLYAYYELN